MTELAPPPSRSSGTRGWLRLLRRPLVVTLPVVLLVGWAGLQTIQTQARREVADRLRSRSVAVGFAAGLIFEERRVGLRRLAAEPGVRDTILALAAARRGAVPDRPLLAAIEGRLDRVPALRLYAGFVVLDTMGQVRSASSPALLASGLTVDSAAWTRMLRGSTIVTVLDTMPPVRDSTEGRTAMMLVATVTRDSVTGRAGVLGVLLVPPHQLVLIMGPADPDAAGRMYAADADGRMVVGPGDTTQAERVLVPVLGGTLSRRPFVRDPGGDLLRGFRPRTAPAAWPPTALLAHALRADSGVLLDPYRDFRGVPVVGTWKWQRAYGFVLIHEIDAERAFGPVRGIRIVFSAVFGLLLVAVVLTELVAARHRRSERSQRFFRYLIDQTEDPIYWMDPEDHFRFSFVNAAACRLYGYAADELLRLGIEDLCAATSPCDASGIWRRLRQGGAERLETVHVRKDGVPVPVELSVNRVEFDGRPYLAGFIRDLTQQRRLEAQLLQSQKMEAIGTLAGGIAHDFNNILTAIAGEADLLRADLPTDHPAREGLERILQAGRRAAALVRQILAFSRKQTSERRPILLQDVVLEALTLLRASLPVTLEVATHVSPSTDRVLADPAQIHQVLINLCTNAAHAIPDGSGLIDVSLETVWVDGETARTVRPLREGRHVRLTVRDTGCGMDRETLNRIFEPFYTTKDPGQGTGLGLAVVHGIMESHYGAVSVYSEPDEGTVFHLYFPVVSTDAAVEEGPTRAVPRGDGRRVLFVDDEAALAQLGSRMLRSLGYEVTAFEDPARALAAFRADPSAFDVVVTDLTMPGLTGIALAEQLHALRADLPVIVATGYGGDQLRSRLADAGLRGEVLSKPFSLDALGHALHLVVGAAGLPSDVPPR